MAIAAILLAAACVFAGAKLGGTGSAPPVAISASGIEGQVPTATSGTKTGGSGAYADPRQDPYASLVATSEPSGSRAPERTATPASSVERESGTFAGVDNSDVSDESETGEMTGDLTGDDKDSATPSEDPAPEAPASVDEPANDELAPSWKLAWADEFDGNTINAANWSHQTDCWGGGNAELQCYTNSPNNSFVKNGKLHIKAIEEQVTGCNTQSGTCNEGQMITRDYSSARLRSLNKRDFKYGRIEFRAKLPGGKGIWPALWMMPTGDFYGGWARSGELDVMEAVNLDTTGGQPGCPGGQNPCNRLHGTLHFGNNWPNNQQNTGQIDPPWDMTTSFNTYAVEWQERQIRWFINGTAYRTVRQNVPTCTAQSANCGWFTAAESNSSAPFDQPFHLIMNLAIGGNWPGPPNEQTTYPQELVVDFVRVYQCSSGEPTGIGCSS